MRATSPLDAATLEPLPVDDDGTTRAPAPITFEIAHDLADASRAALARLHDAPPLVPWTQPDPRLAPRESPRPDTSTFVRMVELDAERLRALPDWWQRYAHGTCVDVTRRFSLERPVERDGTWTFAGRLRTAFGLCTIPFELTLWRQLDGWTRLSIQPHRRVFIAAPYFRAGHRALDLLLEQLMRDLNPWR